jgi:hypothetical protein
LFVFFCCCFNRCHCFAISISVHVTRSSIYVVVSIHLIVCLFVVYFSFIVFLLLFLYLLLVFFCISVVVSISVIVLKLFFGRGMTLGQGPLVFIENVPRKVWRHQKRIAEFE